ncbi:MAG: cation:proton antiporter [Bacteroidales bacterium]|nr:cation:proton antiporter [Bacteroidales bacterium]
MQCSEIIIWVTVVAAFGIIVTASNQLAQVFQKIKLPLITGFIVIGVLAGPYVLKMLPKNLGELDFITDISLGFIAFAAGAEMYLKEIKDRSRHIAIMTTSQIAITFLVSIVLLYFFIDFIPFAENFSQKVTFAFILLTATIFIAPSIATVISMVGELRANGPFTKTAVGVSVFKDILLIILFSITFSVSDMLVSGATLHWYEIFVVLLDLLLSILIGVIYGLIYKIVFKIKKPFQIEILLFLIVGWSTFLLSDLVKYLTNHYLGFSIHLEAILIGITASFYLINYSNFRLNVQRLVEKVGPYIYVAFFTLVGAALSLDALFKYWLIALVFFALRLILIFGSSVVGSLISKDSVKETLLSWTPHIAQAGISLGLITIVVSSFDVFGEEFAAILVAVIVLNQFIGPPLMKFAIMKIGEAHVKSKEYGFDYQRDVFIIGLEGKSIVLGKTLKSQNYEVKIITDRSELDSSDCNELELIEVDEINLETLKQVGLKAADSVVILRDEEEAYRICELIYENFGTPNVIVRLNSREKIMNFKELGAIVVEPASAMLNLLEHFVRSPQATSILLGMDETQNTEDLEVLSKDVHGRALRDLKMPLGILVISITRNGQVMLPHGYTRLRVKDVVTVVGSQDQLEKVRTKLQY